MSICVCLFPTLHQVGVSTKIVRDVWFDVCSHAVAQHANFRLD